jgi:phage recombination protein Bet
MSTALATTPSRRQTRALARAEGWAFTPEETQLIKSTCAPSDVKDSEFKVFLYVAAQRRLNPLLKQIYAIRRKGVITHQTSIDGFRATAARTGMHAGTDDAVYVGTAGKPGFSATVTVWKLVAGVRCPFTATARWEEYLPEAPNDFMWRRMPNSQLGKCAEALALRKAFPEDLGGLYTHDEMAQAPAPDTPGPAPAQAQVVETTAQPVAPNGTAAAPEPAKKAKKRAEPTPVQSPEPPPPELPKINREQQVMLFTVSKARGLKEPELRVLVRAVVKVESTKDIPKGAFDELLACVRDDDVVNALRDYIDTPDPARQKMLTDAILKVTVL